MGTWIEHHYCSYILLEGDRKDTLTLFRITDLLFTWEEISRLRELPWVKMFEALDSEIAASHVLAVIEEQIGSADDKRSVRFFCVSDGLERDTASKKTGKGNCRCFSIYWRNHVIEIS